MTPRTKIEWATLACDAAQIGIGTAYMISGELLGVAFVLLGLTSYVYRGMRNRAYLDGWMHGRADMLQTQMNVRTTEEFAEHMMRTDLEVMRHQIGDRQADKFLTHVLQQVAKSDGSHDNLP
jgi:hypothetical protein